MSKKKEIEKDDPRLIEKEVVLRGSEVAQFSNALELAIGNSANQSSGRDAMWWAGWQLGQLRRPTRDYHDAADHPRIREMNEERRRLKEAFEPAKFEDAQGMIEAANKGEHLVKVRVPSKDMFNDDVALIFAKAISFLDVD